MYAVIQSGGKQYRVQPGDIVQIEKLEGEIGTTVNFNEVLLVSKANGDSAQIWLGKPLLSGANVNAEIVGQGRGEKVMITKMKRRKGYRKTQGHRQYQTQLLVTGVDNGSGEKLALSAEQKKVTLNKFISNLKAKGPAQTPKTLGSRKKRIAAFAGAAKKAAPKAEKSAK